MSIESKIFRISQTLGGIPVNVEYREHHAGTVGEWAVFGGTQQFALVRGEQNLRSALREAQKAAQRMAFRKNAEDAEI